MNETRKYVISERVRKNFEDMLGFIMWVITKKQNGEFEDFVLFGKTVTEDDLYTLKNELFSLTPQLQSCVMTEEQYRRIMDVSREMNLQRYIINTALDIEDDEANKTVVS